MSEGSEYRLSLPDRLVSGALKGGSAGRSRLRREPRNVTHPGCAVAAPPSNRTGSAIHHRERPLGEFVDRGSTQERFERRIETPSQKS